MTRHERKQLLNRLESVQKKICLRWDKLNDQLDAEEDDERYEQLSKQRNVYIYNTGGVKMLQSMLLMVDLDEGMRKSVKTLEGLLNDDKT